MLEERPVGALNSTDGTSTARGPSPRRVAAAGLVGTAIEWYDFLIYGTAAALVFGPQFFPNISPLAGTLAALSTFAVGFLARPLGGALMGHLGDRIGRKRMLVASLVMMGGATAAIGLLPTYASIGVAAPILLVLLRLLQGIGVGGEWGGAVLMAMEHAPASRRTLYASFPQIGLPVGVILASSSFLVLRLTLDTEAFVSWGWRLPFLVSVVLVIFGFILRAKLDESPEFLRARAAGELSRAPLAQVVRQHPGAMVFTAGVSVMLSAFGNILLVFTLAYVASLGAVSSATMLVFTLATALVWAGVIPIGARLASLFGRRRVLLIGVGLCTAWAFPFFWLIDSGSPPAILVACLVLGAVQAIAIGPQAAFVADAFPAAVRYTGASVSYAASGILGGAIAPIIATALTAGRTSATLVSVYLVGVGVISLVCIAALRSPVPERADDTSGVAEHTRAHNVPERS